MTMTPQDPLTGLHHVSAMTADAKGNLDFYTRLLGMRIVKKTVNQDDVSVYHLFYADGDGSPGTDLTFFDFPNLAAARSGSGEINQIALRITGDAAFAYWQKRFEHFGIPYGPESEIDGHRLLPFTDPEGQRLALIDDTGATIPGGTPWQHATVPPEFGIKGLGAISTSTARPENTLHLLTNMMGYRVVSEMQEPDHPDHRTIVLETGPGGVGSYMVVHTRPDLSLARAGRGGVHHVAFRVPTYEAHQEWHDYLSSQGVRVTEQIDRFYFKAMYFREPGGVLYEISSDGPGFDTDEPQELMGENLALPPLLRPYRERIETGLRPLDSSRSVTTADYEAPVKEEVT